MNRVAKKIDLMQVALKTLKMHSFNQALFCSLLVTVDQSKMPGQGHEVRVSAHSENCGTFFFITNKQMSLAQATCLPPGLVEPPIDSRLKNPGRPGCGLAMGCDGRQATCC